ncbi:MAG: cyclic nucleotide-binding domain-containing protein, partial [Bacteroidetes bacterium]|nr:cyclic nucleotide-binding domain-containing protein [Bacteroidota bacterium]
HNYFIFLIEEFMEDLVKTKTLWKDFSKEILTSKSQTLVDILKKIPLLSELSRRELKIISKFAYERTFEVNEFVFETNQPGAAMFIIKEGEVKIVKQNENNEFIEIALLEAGDIFGELALLDSSPRSAGALVSKPTKTIAIFREDLNNLLKTHPEIGGKIMMHLAIITGKRLKATTNHVMQMEKEINNLKDLLNEKQ